jgi:hypothetical protein
MTFDAGEDNNKINNNNSSSSSSIVIIELVWLCYRRLETGKEGRLKTHLCTSPF